jgi:ribosome-binding protein aMBF1 (putative translation factor)
VGDSLQLRRFALGLLQSELAAKLRVPISLVQAWEEDVQVPNQDEWNGLADVLGMSKFALESCNPTWEWRVGNSSLKSVRD